MKDKGKECKNQSYYIVNYYFESLKIAANNYFKSSKKSMVSILSA